LPFIAVGDTSDTGLMMMVNAAGLAGSADTAGADPDPYFSGLMNPYGLRHIAENATTCEEALALVQMMTDKGYYAGGDTATNWTFADRHGSASVVYNAHQTVKVETVRDGFIQSCEREGLREFLGERVGNLTPQDLNEASRLPGVCMETNCSSLTVLIDSEYPHLFTCAWAALGRASQAAYFPLYMGAGSMPRSYLDGTLFAYSHRQPGREVMAELEEDCEETRAKIEAEARTALATGHVRVARHYLEVAAVHAAEEAEKRL
jgi:hypothetical protein